jgi:hypothetical protein
VGDHNPNSGAAEPLTMHDANPCAV